MTELDGSSILITGGTGSLGKSLVRHLLESTNVRRIAIFSRDELKQQVLRREIGEDDRLRWLLGDIRDLERLKLAVKNVDYLIHTAALKQVDTGEYNPMEFIKTNILGSQNVIQASMSAGVKKVIALSTDKASSPINLYGATKLTADKLFVAANNYSKASGTAFSVVRYGNVMGSRGSVIPYWESLARVGKPIPITDFRMTRFWITVNQAVSFIMESFAQMSGGETYVPKIPSMKIVDLAQAVTGDADLKEIGMRPGEKLHEEMISSDDSRRTFLVDDRYIIAPVVADWGFNLPSGVPMKDGHAFQSNTNDQWISVQEMRDFLRKGLS
jgi:UDP-N-acetylglucosamine 4,6-dehydratase